MSSTRLHTGQFRWRALAQLPALATVVSLWYKILPAAPLSDGAFLVLVTAVVLRGYFDPIYTSPFPGLHVEILGHVALTRLCAMVMLVDRRVPFVGYGFMPSLEEWKIGLRHFVYFLIAGIPLAWATRLVRLGPGMPLWKIAATFVGMLWVVALSEEFFFRGLLQQWMVEWTGRPAWALAGASILFGAVHLGFRAIPQLEVRARRGGGRLVLRPGVSARSEYPRQHGDTCFGGHPVARVVCVNV